jgi:hypothetical protein
MDYRNVVVPVRLPNGTVIKAEARASEEHDVASMAELAESLSLDMLSETIGGVAELVETALGKIKPQKVTVEFSIELSYEAGRLVSLLVNGAAKGAFKIGCEWTPGGGSPKL